MRSYSSGENSVRTPRIRDPKNNCSVSKCSVRKKTDFPHCRVRPKLTWRPFLTDSGAFQSPSADLRKSEECGGGNDVPGGGGTTVTVDSHELASHSPLGLNLTEDTALVCPASVNFRL